MSGPNARPSPVLVAICATWRAQRDIRIAAGRPVPPLPVMPLASASPRRRALLVVVEQAQAAVALPQAVAS